MLPASVGIDDEFFDAAVDQVIERKCDERFLKNRDERFWQIVCERAKRVPRPAPRTKAWVMR